MKIHLLMVGHLKSGSEKEMFQEYFKRIHYKMQITEINVRQDTALKAEIYLKHIKPEDYLIILDEKGKNCTSIEFARKIENLNHQKTITFIIGGAAGIPNEIKKLSKESISFGANTWPHIFVRIMLVEQIYRAQQIISNHPYHKE